MKQHKKLRWLIIQPWIRLGGAETLSLQLAYNLKKNNQIAKIATLYIDEYSLPNIYKNIEYVLPRNTIRDILKKSKILRTLLGPTVLLILVLKNASQFDILNPHNPPSHWIASITKIFTKKLIVWTCNEPPTRIPVHSIHKHNIIDAIATLFIDNFIDKIIVKNIDKIVVLDDKNFTRIFQKYHRTPVIINSGMDFEFFSYNKNKTPEKEKKCLTVGALAEIKNQILAIKSIESLIKKDKSYYLNIVGDGPQKEVLINYVKTRKLDKYINFLGKIDNDALKEEYISSDLILLPALNQSWGLTPLEALSSRRLSIVSSDAGISEIIDKYKIGIISDPNVKDFSKSIKYYFNKAESQEILSMIKRGNRIVRDMFSWSRYSVEYINLYSDSTTQ